jgi:hypothetical protein
MHAETIQSRALKGPAPGDLVTESEAAAILGCAVQSLRNWRWLGHGGPRFRKIGKRLVRYHRTDLQAFIDGEAATP